MIICHKIILFQRQRFIIQFYHNSSFPITYTHLLMQRLVWPGSQSITFDIVSRHFENKNNNWCEMFLVKMSLVYHLQIYNKPFLAIICGLPRFRTCNFIINKWHLCFTTIIVFIFKYNGECDRLWLW